LLRSDLRAAYELLRSARCGAGRRVHALFVTRGMAEWIRTAAEWLPAKASRSGPGGAGGGGPLRGELLPGVVPELVPVLAGLFLDTLKEGTR